MTDTITLRKLAEAANQDSPKWEWDDRTVDSDGYVYIPECSYLVGNILLSDQYEGYQDHCDYIAAANPTAIITLLDEIDSLRAALEQQAEQGWQPIETAPKDRTVVLLLRRKEVMAGAFHAELGKFPWLIIEESRDGINGLEDSIHGPTHWMPLPSPPKETKCTRKP